MECLIITLFDASWSADAVPHILSAKICKRLFTEHRADPARLAPPASWAHRTRYARGSRSKPRRSCRAPAPTATPPGAVHSGEGASVLIPRAAVIPRPLQHLQASTHSGVRTRMGIPRAAVLPRPLQHLQVPAPRGHPARHHIPRAAGVVQPLQHLSVSATSGVCTSILHTQSLEEGGTCGRLRAFGPLHERGCSHRRRAPTPHPRE